MSKKSEHPKGDPELERMWAAEPGDLSFRDMSRDETEAMLLRNRVGRLAFALYDQVDIHPIHYIYERGWLYGRTSEGEKVAALKHYQRVAFEVDEVTDLFDRRSIVIYGSFWIMSQQDVPGAPTESDPVEPRQALFRIAVNDLRGRETTTKVRRKAD